MKIPDTDSIRALAEFWDTHDVTEFADQLEEVDQPVFARRPAGPRRESQSPRVPTS